MLSLLVQLNIETTRALILRHGARNDVATVFFYFDHFVIESSCSNEARYVVRKLFVAKTTDAE